jgi:hypothetical protein
MYLPGRENVVLLNALHVPHSRIPALNHESFAELFIFNLRGGYDEFSFSKSPSKAIFSVYLSQLEAML